MASSHLSGRQRDALMQHLDGLFALAQVVTSNAEQAVQLVERTFRRAFSSPSQASDSGAVMADETSQRGTPESADFENPDEARVWLFRLMMQIRDEQAAGTTADASDTPATPSAGSELADLRRRLAEEYVDRGLPPAFATLPSQQRMLLMLCDVERMSCENAGRVLGIDPAESCSRLDEAHLSLHRALHKNANEVERHLLETGLPPNWKRAALNRMAESQLVAVPPTLRPSVVSIFKDVAHPEGQQIRASDAQIHSESERMRTPVGLLKKMAAVLSIIAVAGLLGYGFTYLTRHQPDVNLISISARQAESVEANFQTTSAEQAERFIHDRLGLRVTLPTIADAALQGVSIRTVVENAEVPVVLFQDASSDEPVTVYVYSYAFLDRHEKDLVLERDILRQIADEGNFDLHDLGDSKALVWRNRDDIFIAITSGDAEELRGRISFPS